MMRWRGKIAFAVLTVVLAFFLSASTIKAETYYVTSNKQYFPSVYTVERGYGYINFHTSLLPLSFQTLYRDSNQRIHFNNTWIKTNIDITLTSFFTNNWLNYTCTMGPPEFGEEQQFYVPEPVAVYFDGAKQTKGTTWTYSDITETLTIWTTESYVSITWTPEEGGEGETEYSNPTVTSDTVWYVRADTHTVNTVLGYKLNETQTSTQLYTSVTAEGNLTAYYGWRVWKVNSKGEVSELTSGYKYSWRVASAEGQQNVLWNCPGSSLQVGYDAIMAKLYMRFAEGPWIEKATFISDQLLKKTLVGTEWAFQTYTKKLYSGGSTTVYVYWGASAKETSIAGIEFVDADVYEVMNYKVQSGDFVGFVVYPYVNLVGSTFYGLCMLMICVPIYNRNKSFTPIIVLLILFGGATGIFTLLIPEIGLGVGWIFFLLGLAGLLYKVFR